MAKRSPLKYCGGCRYNKTTGCEMFKQVISAEIITVCKLRGYKDCYSRIATSSKSTGAWAQYLEKQ